MGEPRSWFRWFRKPNTAVKRQNYGNAVSKIYVKEFRNPLFGLTMLQRLVSSRREETKKLSTASDYAQFVVPEVTKKVTLQSETACPATSQLATRFQRESNAVVQVKGNNYLGMLEYRKEDEALIVKKLIYDLKPEVAVGMLPGIPAYILFMCMRYADHINDEEGIRSLLSSAIVKVKKVIKHRHEDLDTIVLWLSNVLRLLHIMKQYSGEKAFQKDNTDRQNEQCLRNFDLCEFRQVLGDLVYRIYQSLIRCMRERVQRLVVPAILEHEAIAGLHQKPVATTGQSTSADRGADSPVDTEMALEKLIKELTTFHRCLSLHAVNSDMVYQIFRQILYFISASALNELLQRKDLCNGIKGMQIRFNLSYLEQWARDQRLAGHWTSTARASLLDVLAPILQASQLLQACKTDNDADFICGKCNKLSMFQILQILNMYTPVDDFEEPVPKSLIFKVGEELMERQQLSMPVTLLMDTKYNLSLQLPFSPSSIRLEYIDVPEILNLPMLKKV